MEYQYLLVYVYALPWYPSTDTSETVVGMSAYMMHGDPTIFPSPDTFRPSRWLDPVSARHLEKYLVPFGKGPRQCVGMP
jgi:cytochrome P450